MYAVNKSDCNQIKLFGLRFLCDCIMSQRVLWLIRLNAESVQGIDHVYKNTQAETG